jgi:hypothetical protein
VEVAVKVRTAEGQVGFEPPVCDMLTAGVTAFTEVMLMLLEVAGFAVTPAKLDVITQLTTCPAVSVEDVKVELLLPTLLPSTCH